MDIEETQFAKAENTAIVRRLTAIPRGEGVL
jgi:hypothetical protein